MSDVATKEPRPEKVAVVAEVAEKIENSDGIVLTEYRGLGVSDLAQLRRSLAEAGAEYKIYKNTLVRIAARNADLDIEEMLTGPTAITFVGEQPDGSPGDPVMVAKALKAFAKANEALVVKGGVLDGSAIDAAGVMAMADLDSKDVLLAKLAGAFAAPMQQFAALLQAVPQNFAYGLSALIEQGGAPGAPASSEAAEEPAGDDSSGDEEASAEAEASADGDDAASEAAAEDDAASGGDETEASTEDGAEASDEAEAPADEEPAAADAADDTEEG